MKKIMIGFTFAFAFIIILKIDLSYGYQEITSLPEMTEAPALNDVIPIVDISDTTEGPGGTTKRISIFNLLVGRNVFVAPSDAPWYRKLLADYVCDGTDDQIEINLATHNGGTVTLLEGTYYISSSILINKDHTVLEGLGDTTKIKIVDGHNSQLAMIVVENSGSTIEHVGIRNLSLDGNSANVSGNLYVGIKITQGNYITIENILAENGGGLDGYAVYFSDDAGYNSYCTVKGLRKGTFRTNAIEFRKTRDSIISQCFLNNRIELYSTSNDITILNNQFNDTRVVFGTYSNSEMISNISIIANTFHQTTNNIYNLGILIYNCDGAFISNNLFYSNDDSASLDIQPGTVPSYGIRIKDNTFVGRGLGFMGYDGTIDGNMFFSTTASGNGSHGIYNSGRPDNWTIINNHFRAVSGVFNDDGVYLSDAHNITIKNNLFTDFDANQLGGIQFATACTETKVTYNKFYNCAAASKIVNPANAQVIAFNDGYKTENSGTAVISYKETSVSVAHGLEITPSIDNISITPTSSLGDALYFWVDTIDATNFVIHLNAAPNVAPVTFSWRIGTFVQ